MILPELEIPRLCWECLACLKHLYMLRRKALNAKEILDKLAEGCTLDVSLQSKTDLGTSYIFAVSICDDNINNIEETEVTNTNLFLDKGSTPKNYDIKKFKEDKEFYENDLTQAFKRSSSINVNTIRDSKLLEKAETKNLKKSKQKKIKAKRKKKITSYKHYTCSECKVTFESRGKYEYHRQKHRGRVQCSICSRDFSSRSALTTHRSVVHTAASQSDDGFRNYCKPCAKFFKTSCSYRKHLRTSVRHINPESLRFSCQACDKRFVRSKERDEHHERVHLKRNRLQCVRCSRQYCSVRALRSHVRTRHTATVAKRDFVCEICGVSFKTAQVLKGHQRIHTKEKATIEEKDANKNS
ncbi:unnamed protein product [Parnassius apollo]|uniref:(apollo) hypothetical protein n=1 Tax=Parnassius apollo TaxID=110799 RepID=A0A8S3X1Q8_PARAO|nr:unnamed protein product [Parnassius apollo]